MEYNNWAIEVFDHKPYAVIDGVVIEDNIMRLSGYGWGSQRPNLDHTAHICNWFYIYNNGINLIIRNNIFDCSWKNTVFWSWSDGRIYPGLTISNNTFYQKATESGYAMWYAPLYHKG